MPFDKLKTHGNPEDETLFILRDPDNFYTHSDVVELMEKAEAQGYSICRGSELDQMTVRQLDELVHRKQ